MTDPIPEDAIAPATSPDEQSSSHLISRILSPAIQFWLRSQVEQVKTLHFEIQGGDRQILGGQIAGAIVTAEGAVYQGLHLTQVDLRATGIRVNLGQVLRGKPLRLLAIVPVVGTLRLSEADLNASLQAPLLAAAVREWLMTLLQSEKLSILPEDLAPEAIAFEQLQISLGEQRLILMAEVLGTAGRSLPLTLGFGLQVVEGHLLQVISPQWFPQRNARRGLPLPEMEGFQIDLGADVNLETLTLSPGALTCQGRINVIPV